MSLKAMAATPTTAPSTAPASRNSAQFVREFQAAVVNGCLAKASREIRNPRGYCGCYANAFVKRYSPETLFVINRVAKNPEIPGVVALMMTPEIKACQAAN